MNAVLPIPPVDTHCLKPGRLWSLWDVISAQLTGLAPLIFQLSLYELLPMRHDGEGSALIGSDTKQQVLGWMKMATIVANDFELQAVHDRVGHITSRLEKGMTWDRLADECRVLREAIGDGLKGQLLYRYFSEQAAVLMRWQEDWKPVLEKFPSASDDIRRAVDCWALGHGTAAVFHLMRVLEYGLAALAHDVGKEVGTKNWQNIIDQIDSEVRLLGKTLPGGMAKADRLQFLSEATKEFTNFKDGWRNYAAHGRAKYDIHQARSVLEHVRGFMTVLSTRLSEMPLSEQPIQVPD